MVSHMRKILDGLYVGNSFDAKNTYQLDMYNISHIVSILAGNCTDMMSDKSYLCIVADDRVEQNIMQFFSIANDFIHAARLSGHNVLVHCLHGASRSVTIVCAYIMAVTNLNHNEALKVIRERRSEISPNLGFQIQLQQYERSCLQEEKERLGQLFPTSILITNDLKECRKSLPAGIEKEELTSKIQEEFTPYCYAPSKERTEYVEKNSRETKKVNSSFSQLFPTHVRKPFLKQPMSDFTDQSERSGIQLMQNVCLFQVIGKNMGIQAGITVPEVPIVGEYSVRKKRPPVNAAEEQPLAQDT